MEYADQTAQEDYEELMMMIVKEPGEHMKDVEYEEKTSQKDRGADDGHEGARG